MTRTSCSDRRRAWRMVLWVALVCLGSAGSPRPVAAQSATPATIEPQAPVPGALPGAVDASAPPAADASLEVTPLRATPAGSTLKITSPLGRTGLVMRVRIVAQITVGQNVQMSAADFYVDGAKVGTVSNGPPYAVEWVDGNPFETRTITVQARDPRWHLMQVQFGDASLWIKDTGQPLGTPVRLRLWARDISLARSRATDTSIQNLLPATVTALLPEAHPSQVLVHLLCGGQGIWARITARAAQALMAFLLRIRARGNRGR